MLRPSLSGLRRRLSGLGRGRHVSPELMLRPSLSGEGLAVAGPPQQQVSPELMLRPSLSAPNLRGDRPGVVAGVSPELMLRPSLSVPAERRPARRSGRGVAGAYAPAFVERYGTRSGRSGSPACVAGAYAPAFVERGLLPVISARTPTARVAGAYAPAFVERATPPAASPASPPRCRRSLCSGLR